MGTNSHGWTPEMNPQGETTRRETLHGETTQGDGRSQPTAGIGLQAPNGTTLQRGAAPDSESSS